MTRAGGNQTLDVRLWLEAVRLMEGPGRHWSKDRLAESLGIGRASLTRMMAAADSQLGMRILHTRETGWQVASWGILDEVKARAIVSHPRAKP